MSVIAILGAGPLGGALAHTLATRSRVAEVRLIDPDQAVAQGKALDILQSGPVENVSTRLTAHGSRLAAAGAQVVVIADSVAGVEHAGESGLAELRQLRDAGVSGPFLFAGAGQRELMARAVTEIRLPARWIVGSAPTAFASALRAMAAITADASAVEVALNVVGVPPKHAVITWQEATISGQPLTTVIAPHEIAGITARLGGLWPPGPYALASAAARVAEALCFGSRRQYSCFVDVGRGRIAAMPVVLKAGGLERIVQPALSSVERTALENALDAS